MSWLGVGAPAPQRRSRHRRAGPSTGRRASARRHFVVYAPGREPQAFLMRYKADARALEVGGRVVEETR